MYKCIVTARVGLNGSSQVILVFSKLIDKAASNLIYGACKNWSPAHDTDRPQTHSPHSQVT